MLWQQIYIVPHHPAKWRWLRPHHITSVPSECSDSLSLHPGGGGERGTGIHYSVLRNQRKIPGQDSGVQWICLSGLLTRDGLNSSCPGADKFMETRTQEQTQRAALPGMKPPQRPGSIHPAKTSLQTYLGPVLPLCTTACQTGAGLACCRAAGKEGQFI